MNLATNYMGLRLKNPLMPGASPLVNDLGNVRQLEDAGASAIVLHSLFEEQITMEMRAYVRHVEEHSEAFSEAQSFMAAPEDFALTPDRYMEQISRIKQAVDVPVIASLNGATLGGWTNCAKLMERAGADALELNFYFISTSPGESDADVLTRAVEILSAVKATVGIPVALKLSPFFTSLPHAAEQFVLHGADGLILFNRFYQPDIDIEALEVIPSLKLSDSNELTLRLRWLAILSASIDTSYAVTGGVHSAEDAIKAIMTGAHAVQLVSCLLKNGIPKLGQILDDMGRWIEEHEYESLNQLRGSMSLRHCPDPAAFERGNYLRILQGWQT